ncbi:hypothetical protein YC2023_020858 [Brassica napus]
MVGHMQLGLLSTTRSRSAQSHIQSLLSITDPEIQPNSQSHISQSAHIWPSHF